MASSSRSVRTAVRSFRFGSRQYSAYLWGLCLLGAIMLGTHRILFAWREIDSYLYYTAAVVILAVVALGVLRNNLWRDWQRYKVFSTTDT